ncbi:hypothetical protein VTI74DRAFT_11247 [Chaetomium olivicolor]
MCDGVLSFHGIYDQACDHWRCPTCHAISDDYSAARAEPHSGRNAAAATTNDIPPTPEHLQTDQCFPDTHYISHSPSTPFSYAAMYLQNAARPGTVTFAEAYPAPTARSIPISDPLISLAHLKLDYSAACQAGNGSARNSDMHDFEVGETIRQREMERAREREEEAERRDREREREKRKRKAEKEKEEDGKGYKKRDKGKGKDKRSMKEVGKGKGKEAARRGSGQQSKYPAGYQPATVEDVPEEEGGECYGGHSGW